MNIIRGFIALIQIIWLVFSGCFEDLGHEENRCK